MTSLEAVLRRIDADLNDLLTRAQEGAAAGGSVAQTVAAYSVPEEYSDFQAPADRLASIVQLIYEGR